MSSCIVFYESWQLDCCGSPFDIGDSIKWIVKKCDKIASMVEIERIDYVYEAHSDEWTQLNVFEGIVSRIQILYEKFAPEEGNPTSLQRVKGGKVVDVITARQYESKLEGLYPAGFIVTFVDYNIRSATREDITFC